MKKKTARKRVSAKIGFSYRELVDLRRFLNRAIACAEGRCLPELTGCWYYCKPLLKKVEEAIQQLRAD